jgi:hypothetical protein
MRSALSRVVKCPRMTRRGVSQVARFWLVGFGPGWRLAVWVRCYLGFVLGGGDGGSGWTVSVGFEEASSLGRRVGVDAVPVAVDNEVVVKPT